MVIAREVNGKIMQFKLTDKELYQAYMEQKHLNDVEDVESAFDYYEDDDVIDLYGCTRKEAEERFDDIAWQMRRNIDKYDMDWEYAREDAIKEVLARSRDEKK